MRLHWRGVCNGGNGGFTEHVSSSQPDWKALIFKTESKMPNPLCASSNCDSRGEQEAYDSQSVYLWGQHNSAFYTKCLTPEGANGVERNGPFEL